MALGTPPIPYTAYERRRLGNPSTRWAGVLHMVRRSFGASSFADFWRYWNPLFSYYLYYWCYRPLVQVLPRSLAVVLTFAVSGAIHDVFGSLATGQLFVLFVPLFAVFGTMVVVEEGLDVSLSWAPRGVRPMIHMVLIGGPLAVGLALRAGAL